MSDLPPPRQYETDTAFAEASLARADQLLESLLDDGRDFTVATDYGLLALARQNVKVAIEALELRQRWKPKPSYTQPVGHDDASI